MKRTLAVGVAAGIGLTAVFGPRLNDAKVGPADGIWVQADGSTTSATGRFLQTNTRPVDLAVSPSGAIAAIKDNTGIRILDLASMKEIGAWKSTDGMSAIGIAFSGDKDVWATTAGKLLVHLSLDDGGKPTAKGQIDLGTASYPNGLVINGDHAFVALSMKNQLAEVDLGTMSVVRTLDVGIAPFALTLDKNKGRIFLSEQGGMRPSPGTLTASSAGTRVGVDKRGIALAGAVAEVSLQNWKLVREIPTPTLPSSVAYDAEHDQVLVACANGDQVLSIDPASGSKKVIDISAGPYKGSLPTGLALIDHKLYVAVAGTNEVGRFQWNGSSWSPEAWAKTDWYPVAVAGTARGILAANVKGLGTRSPKKPDTYNSGDFTGTIRELTPAQFGRRSLAENPKSDSSLPPMRHVVYVIKENRTYDQVFGDVPSADGDPKLCQFGQAITPNQHAIARQFVSLDNYYCSGVLSADGHSWATEGSTTPYLERAFGGFQRSYTFGDDPLTYSSTGFIWDALLAKGLTFKNYGEFDYAESGEKMSGVELYKKTLSGAKIAFKQNIGIANVRTHSVRNYPGWNMAISDQYRMDRFEEDFKQTQASGKMADFTIVYLPQDHTGGPVSPQAHVADNDLAVGRLLSLLSHSRFWKDMVVFVNEDDPSGGTDHVDGHRSTCLVAGPYVKRGQTISHFYDQSSVLRTICEIFGLPPLNAKTALAPPMGDLFTSRANMTPFMVKGETTPLDRSASAKSLYANFVADVDITRHEVESRDMDRLNRAIWEATRPGERYPSAFAGAHGKGLAKKGLKLDRGAVDGHD